MTLPPTEAVWLERGDGVRFPVTGNCALGRSASNAIVIASPKVSRNHATIHAQDGGEFWLIDLGSINGTLLNERRAVQPQRLKDGDRIVIADTAFIFHQHGEAQELSLGGTLPTVPEVRQETRWLLLADIEGFTPLSQRLPPEELAGLVGQWLRAGREIVHGNGGWLNKYTGDGFLACWSSAAESAGQVVAALRAFRVRREAEELKFRVIVHHAGLSVGGAAGSGEENLMGPEVNFLFRVEKIAGSAGVAFCCSDAARALLATQLALEPIPGRHELKGFPGSYEFFAWR